MTRIPKFLTFLLAASLGITFLSCNGSGDEKKVEETVAADTTKVETAPAVAPAFTPFKVLMIKHTVADFAKWKPEYEAHDSMRKAYGIKHFHMGTGADDPKTVIIYDKIDDVQKAKDFTMLPNLKDVMKKAGVIGKPEFGYMDVIRFDDTKNEPKDRMIIIHKVKDFDVWVKAFDADKANREANGMVDKALSRGIDDPNMVYIVLVITDAEKAKARANSEEMKKIMTDAGVVGAPQFFRYKIID